MESATEAFLKLAFGPEAKGFICIAFLHDKQMSEHFFEYPEQVPEAATLIDANKLITNAYFCPQVFKTPRRRKDNVSMCPSAWADLDTCSPEILELPPSVSISSSPERYQALWHFTRPVAPHIAEDVSRRIAYHHAQDGADKSGWDLTQLLRIPGSLNLKYVTTPRVSLLAYNQASWTVKDFEVFPEVKHSEFLKTPMPSVETLKKLGSAADVLQSYRGALLPSVTELFNIEPASGADWSAELWKLEMVLLECGLERDEVYVVAREAACNKYARDGKGDEPVWIEVCKAWVIHQERINAAVFPGASIVDLMSPEEEALAGQQEGFIERYIEWASSLGDAAIQYHQAGAFTILSALLSGRVILPTSYGPVVPNLWFMILGDTTLTRKSTAMDIATDLLMEVDPDCILATDGSVEGLLQQLEARPKRPSIFLRDEFSGLLEMMVKREYYAGMAEVLTKLYDGKMQKRVLRKETVTVRDPILLILAGGIRNRVQGLLTHEHVSSGFIPRFIFVTAESDTSRLQPLGPPTVKDLGNKDKLLDEMEKLVSSYGVSRTVHIKARGEKISDSVRTEVSMSPEAWLRYNQLEQTLVESGLDSEKPELITPLFDRLSKNILKAAILIAAARQMDTEGVQVEVIDILHAIRYGKGWRNYALEIVNGIGKTTYERDLERILNAIIKRPGFSRSQLMQSYHLSARDATQVFDTLLQRGQITARRTEGTSRQTYYPMVGALK